MFAPLHLCHRTTSASPPPPSDLCSFAVKSARFVPLLAAALALLAPTACYREATDASAAITHPRSHYTGTAPWTIDGVRPGQTFDEVKLLLGEPRDLRESYGQRFARWGPRDTAVSFDKSGRVTDVMGSTVKAGEQTIVSSGASEDEVAQILGPGKVQKSHRPKGSGVISLGREHTSTTLVYDNAGVRFELCVWGEAAGHYRAYIAR